MKEEKESERGEEENEIIRKKGRCGRKKIERENKADSKEENKQSRK